MAEALHQGRVALEQELLTARERRALEEREGAEEYARQENPLGAMSKILDLLIDAVENQARIRAERERRVASLIRRLCAKVQPERGSDLWHETGEVLKLLDG
jgi:hypothetical protein